MKPVDQDKFGMPDGNCFAACIASILELPLAEVPNFVTFGDKWYERTVEFLRCRGFTPIYVTRAGAEQMDIHALIEAGHYFIVTGKSPRGDFDHCVVQHGSELVHDPHPSRAFIDGPWKDFILIVPNTLAA